MAVSLQRTEGATELKWERSGHLNKTRLPHHSSAVIDQLCAGARQKLMEGSISIAPRARAGLCHRAELVSDFRIRPFVTPPGKVATIRPPPITIANQFGVGHRIRGEVTSLNFPKLLRNLNREAE